MGSGELEPGALIGGDFVVESTLREGGGAVYRAVQRSTGRRRVVRLLPAPMGGAGASERFAALADASPAIESPHVPAVVAGGFDLTLGVAWLAMESLEGVPLPVLLGQTGPLPMAVASGLMAQVFDALASAHGVGVVHGALRASDVFVAAVSRVPGAYDVSILGFGLARSRADQRGGAGEAMTGGPAEDVRALGVLAFAMLSGGRDAAGLTPSARLGELGGAGLRPPDWFDAWYQRCVDRDRQGQFESVVDAEAAWAFGVVGSAGPGRRKEWRLGAATLLTLGLVVALAGLAWRRSRTEAPAPRVLGAINRIAVPAVACPEGMVWLAGGQFLMGSREDRGEPDQRPRHVVNLSGFCLDRTEVTVGAYGRYWSERGQPRDLAPAEGLNCNWNQGERVDHPINCVDWTMAREYCEWARHPGGARRLPTEAQWEYAAHGPEGGRYPWGNAVPDERVCWSGVAPRVGTCRVGESLGDLTSTGLVDLAGNVAEWTADLYEAPYRVRDAAVRIDPTGPASTPEGLRTFRGGTWAISVPSALRSASRGRHTESMRSRGVGFRCARGP